MEKHAERFGKNFPGLLIFIVFINVFSAAARPVSWNYLWSLRFRQSSETLFTETDNSFYVEIEGVTPDSVQIAVNSLPQNVSFVSSKKETVLIPVESDSGGSFSTGTRIVIWMKFLKTGFYKINPVDVIIDGGFYQIPFNSVEVFENPRFIHPELSVSFNNLNPPGRNGFEIEEGQHVIFTVKARYASSVKDIFWNIPKNSVFKKLREYDFSETGDSYSHDFKPLAVFDWQPLKKGMYELPEIFVTAVSYNNITHDIKCPPSHFNVAGRTFFRNEKKTDSPFAYAFIEPPASESSSAFSEPKKQDILNLIELHRKERHSVPFINSVSEQRKQAEIQAGLSPANTEPSVILFSIIMLCVFVFLFVAVLMFVLKKKRLWAVFTSLFVVFTVFSCLYGFRVFTLRGIYAGGKMSPIPEKSIPSGVTIQAGSVVFVIREAGDWMYIRYNTTSGWVPSENIYLIR